MLSSFQRRKLTTAAVFKTPNQAAFLAGGSSQHSQSLISIWQCQFLAILEHCSVQALPVPPSTTWSQSPGDMFQILSTSSRCSIGPQIQLILILRAGETFTKGWKYLLQEKKIQTPKIPPLNWVCFCAFVGLGCFAQPFKPPGGEGIRANRIVAIPSNYLNWLFCP